MNVDEFRDNFGRVFIDVVQNKIVYVINRVGDNTPAAVFLSYETYEELTSIATANGWGGVR